MVPLYHPRPYCNCNSLTSLIDAAAALVFSLLVLATFEQQLLKMLETVMKRTEDFTLLWRLWSAPKTECCSCIFSITFKEPCLESRCHHLNCSSLFFSIFCFYAVDNLIQLFSFWSICFRQVSACTFVWLLCVIVCLSVVFQWPDGSLFTGTSVLSLYLISICSLPINQRCKTALPLIKNLLLLIRWLNFFINILATFHWQNNLKDLLSPNWVNWG